jgi:hypothetical protein
MVAGCAALLRGAVPSLPPAELLAALLASPVRVSDPESGLDFPRLDCAHANFLVNPSAVPALPAAGALLLGLGLLWSARVRRWR